MLMVLLVILVTLLLYAPPGLLLYALLHQRGYGRIHCLGLGLALLTVLYSILASAVGYHLWLQSFATLALDIGLFWAVIRRGRLPVARRR